MGSDRNKALKRVTLLATGGTIASKADASGRVSPAVTGEELTASVPGLSDEAEVRVEQFGNRLGLSLELSDFLEITKRVSALLDGDTDAVVVTHGTSTIVESAYLMDLLLAHDHLSFRVYKGGTGRQAASGTHSEKEDRVYS